MSFERKFCSIGFFFLVGKHFLSVEIFVLSFGKKYFFGWKNNLLVGKTNVGWKKFVGPKKKLSEEISFCRLEKNLSVRKKDSWLEFFLIEKCFFDWKKGTFVPSKVISTTDPLAREALGCTVGELKSLFWYLLIVKI